MVEAESPLVTVNEAARFLRVTPRTIRYWCQRGDLPGVRIGGVWRIDTSGQLNDIDTGERGERPTTGRLR